MTPSELYQAMSMPKSCVLGKRVFKKLFFDNATLTAGDKRALTQDVDTITWQYTLKPSTLPIQPYTDDDCEYLEVAVIEVQLKERRSATRIAEVIHRAIPYPVFVVMTHDDAITISVAHKRFSRAERGAVVAEDVLTTPWMAGADRTEAESGLLASHGRLPFRPPIGTATDLLRLPPCYAHRRQVARFRQRPSRY